MVENLPSIVPCLTSEEHARAVFVQPTRGKELTVLHGVSSDDSPSSEILMLVRLRLPPYAVVPTHVHEEKEKAYVYNGTTEVKVIIFEGDTPRTYVLSRESDTVVIPPQRPHAIICPAEGAKITVVSSSKNAADIRWQADKDTLTQNLHVAS